MIIDQRSTIIGPIRQDRLRPLAVTSPQRLSLLPDVPTLRELGFPEGRVGGLRRHHGAGQHAAGRCWRLNAEFNKALQQPDVRKSWWTTWAATTAAARWGISATWCARDRALGAADQAAGA